MAMTIFEILFWGFSSTFSGPNQTLTHVVTPTKMIKNGTVVLKTGPDQSGQTKINIRYDLKTTWYAPVGDQKGSESQNLPTKFLTEAGYLELEKSGAMLYDGVEIYHIGRFNLGGYRNMHKIQLVKAGDWEATAFYHPEIPASCLKI